jgi:hypothetical protein
MPVCGVVWGLLGVGPGWSFGPYAGRLAPSDWAIVWAGVGAIGPAVCWGWPGLLGAIGGGLQRLGRVGWPHVDWGGVGPGAIGGAGRLAPDHANPGGFCNDFPVILPFL